MTKIEWVRNADGTAGKTWNPIVGCSVVSPACTNCYAMKMAARLEAMARAKYDDWYADVSNIGMPEGGVIAPLSSHYAGLTQPSRGGAVWTGKVAQAPDHILTAPLRWRKPRRIFVNSMGDMFHESVPDEWIDRVFAVMALCPQRTFQILTKRSQRMREYMNSGSLPARIEQAMLGFVGDLPKPWEWTDGDANSGPKRQITCRDPIVEWPMGHIWLGVTVEDQQRANERIPDLLATPAALHFVSIEPCLGSVDLRHIDVDGHSEMDALKPSSWREIWEGDWSPEATGVPFDEAKEAYMDEGGVWPPNDNRPAGLRLVIAGGETGPNARPMHPDWARKLRDDCAAANTPFFFKSHGDWLAIYDRDNDDQDWRTCPAEIDGGYLLKDTQRIVRNGNGRYLNLAGGHGFHGERVVFVERVGKARSGRLLDGVEHNGLPEVSHG